jgi:hypothetical protein
MAGDILFVTGQLGDCTLGLYDTRSPNPVFSPVELPEQVKRKAFDDLIIDGKSLLAVDNVIMPKWLVRYDISDPAKPKPTEVTELMAGVNEHVVRGVVGTKYLALFSQSMWDGGESQDVQIYDKSKAFAPQARICLWSKLSHYRSELLDIRGYPSDPQMSFAGDLLLLAGYGEGVGVLDCSAGHAQNALPGRLFYRNADGKDIPVLDAVGLPAGKRVAVWLHQGEAPVVVETNMLICRPSTE